MGRGSAHQSFHVRVAADHAVQHDDVCASDLRTGLSEVQHLAVDALCQPDSCEEMAGRRLVGIDDLDVRRPQCAGAQELDLDGADAPADFENSRANNSPINDRVDDAPPSRIESAPQVSPQVFLRVLLIEELGVGVRTAARRHLCSR